MLLTTLDRLGELNPQWFRELKGRLKPRNIWLTLGVSAIAHITLLKIFTDLLPDASGSSSYALLDSAGNHIKDAAGVYVPDWQKWWQDIFRLINWALPYAITVPTVYLLATDIQQEESRGTLNFVRLSPQSARTILLGKLLGVPVLVYLGVATWLPLHLMAAIGTGGPALGFLVSYYSLIGVGSYLLFSIALLGGCLTKPQAKVGAQFAAGQSLLLVLLVIFVVVPLYLTWNVFTAWDRVAQYLWYFRDVEGAGDWPQWFYLSLKNPWVAHAFTLTNLLLASYWVWQALNRHFHTPNRTLLGKQQSYGLVAYSQVLMLGFCSSSYWRNQGSNHAIGLFMAICLVNIGWFIALIMLLSPGRQTVIDWARYRHDRQGDQGQTQRRSLLHDLLWNDRSPAVVAIMTNLVLASALLLPWVLTFANVSHRWIALLGLVFNGTLLTIYAVIFQWVLLAKTTKRVTWAVGAVVITILIMPILTALLAWQTVGTAPAGLLLFSPFFWVALEKASGITIGLSLLAEWVALIWASRQLAQAISRLGASESQALLAATKLARSN